MPYDKDLFPCYCYPATQEKRINTTFFSDFMLALPFGKSAVVDTFNRAFNEWKDHHEYLVELAAVTNHLAWFSNDHHLPDAAEQFSDWYHKCTDYFWSKKHSQEDSTFFFEVLD